MPPVPTTQHVKPGAQVNIVLKADQPTGRTVAGTVATLLTRGNHPRGIKVRLMDGRVGRVQSIGAAGQADVSQTSTVSRGATSRDTRSAPEPPTQAIGLDAYIKTPRQRGKGALQPVAAPSEVETVPCPVCTDFEGDEAAVAHHVSSHFGD